MSVPPFFRVIGFTVEPHAHNITQRKGGQEASLVVLPSDEAQCHLKFRDIIRIGVVHLWWYVATVYAIKLRHNIFSATRTIHIFCDQTSFVVLSESPVFIVVLSKSRLCARPFGKKTTGFPLDFLGFQDGEEMRLVKSVESFDQKVGVDYLVPATVFSFMMRCP